MNLTRPPCVGSTECHEMVIDVDTGELINRPIVEGRDPGVFGRTFAAAYPGLDPTCNGYHCGPDGLWAPPPGGLTGDLAFTPVISIGNVITGTGATVGARTGQACVTNSTCCPMEVLAFSEVFFAVNQQPGDRWTYELQLNVDTGGFQTVASESTAVGAQYIRNENVQAFTRYRIQPGEQVCVDARARLVADNVSGDGRFNFAQAEVRLEGIAAC